MIPDNTEPVQLKVDSHIAHIILDNPPENRMDKYFFESLQKIVHLLKKDNSLKTAVIYSGGRHFSSGTDVGWLKSKIIEPYTQGVHLDTIIENEVMANSRLITEIERLPMPVIAVINGFCIGAAFELALACTIRICSSDAVIGCPELEWDIITGINGSIRLEKLVGKSKAKELILRGEIITAQEAHEIGIANKVVKKKDLMTTAFGIASLLASERKSHINQSIINSILQVENLLNEGEKSVL